MDSGRRKSATPGTKTGLATQTAQKGQFRTRIAMTAELWSNGTACRQTCELNVLRCEIQQLQGCNNDASTSLACLCRVQNETFDARIRKCKVGRSSAAVPDAVLEVYLEHLLIMKKDELRVNSPMSRLHTTLPPENQEH